MIRNPMLLTLIALVLLPSTLSEAKPLPSPQNKMDTNEVPKGPKNPIKIIFLGDSITQSGARKGGYVDLVNKKLPKELNATVVGAGISGNKVPDLQKRLQKDVLDQNPSHVVIYIGINDVWHSQSGRGTSPAKFESGLNEIVDRIKTAGAVPILCTPTVIGEKALGDNPLDEKLELFSQITRSISQKKHLPLIDLRQQILDDLQQQPNQEKRQNSWLLTTDGVHMNSKGNQWLADQFCKQIPSIVKQTKRNLLRHIVLFKFKKDVSQQEIDKIVAAFDNLPVEIEEISEYESGTNNSPEKLDKGFTHAFLVSFPNKKARDAYLPHPKHKAFVKLLDGKLEDVLVFDFIDSK